MNVQTAFFKIKSFISRKSHHQAYIADFRVPYCFIAELSLLKLRYQKFRNTLCRENTRVPFGTRGDIFTSLRREYIFFSFLCNLGTVNVCTVKCLHR